MKKLYLLLFCLLLMVGFCQMEISADYDTGHSDFVEINIPSDSDGRLLIELFEHEKEAALKKVKKTFIGWRVKTLCHSCQATYVGKTIFSRYNNTSSHIDFNYSSKIVDTQETSVKTTGSIGGSVNTKGKALSGGLEGQIRKEIGKASTFQVTEQTDFKVRIQAGTKVSLIVKGDLKVSNGVAKYYFFGIPLKKGAWEVIDVMSEYYELCEEIVQEEVI